MRYANFCTLCFCLILYRGHHRSKIEAWRAWRCTIWLEVYGTFSNWRKRYAAANYTQTCIGEDDIVIPPGNVFSQMIPEGRRSAVGQAILIGKRFRPVQHSFGMWKNNQEGRKTIAGCANITSNNSPGSKAITWDFQASTWVFFRWGMEGSLYVIWYSFIGHGVMGLARWVLRSVIFFGFPFVLWHTVLGIERSVLTEFLPDVSVFHYT